MKNLDEQRVPRLTGGETGSSLFIRSGFSPQKRRIVVLDVARAIAAVSVFLFHYGLCSFGYLGVELFFLLSGFVLSLPSRHKSIFSFTWSRCVRLYPTYWVAMTLTACSLALSGAHLSMRTVAANATMLTAFLGESYIDGVYWSLTEEIVFYLLVGVTGSFRGGRNCLWLAVTMAGAGLSYGVLSNLHVLTLSPDSKLEMVLKYFPFFASGMASAVIFRRFANNEEMSWSGIWLAATLCGLLPLITALYQYSAHLPETLARYEALAVGGVFVLFYSLVGIACREPYSPWGGGRVAGFASGAEYIVRGVAFFGACTYPFYLLHDRFAKAVASMLGLVVAEPVHVFLIFCMVSGLSVAIHYAVEDRMAHKDRRLNRW